MKLLAFLFCLCLASPVAAQLVLMGENPPHADVLDGDFDDVWSAWRAFRQSPHWTSRLVEGEQPIGLHQGTLFCMSEKGVAESEVLSANPRYQTPRIGDVWEWRFGADLEYISDGTLTISLVFGQHERVLADRVPLKGSDKTVEHFKGTYTISAEDAAAGLPFVRVTFYAGNDIKVFLHYVTIRVLLPEYQTPQLQGSINKANEIQLSWTDKLAKAGTRFGVYRQGGERSEFEKIGETSSLSFTDKEFISGKSYRYVVSRIENNNVSEGSNVVVLRSADKQAPAPPTGLQAEVFDTEIRISWKKSRDKDVAAYSVYRTDEEGQVSEVIAREIKKNNYLDFTPRKGMATIYQVYAYDYSGNRSEASAPLSAQVKMVAGASFSDLLNPMPIHQQLRSDLWGAPGVLPRDPDNGIEHPDWSYWGGRPVRGKDGLYHMCVTRWPANATKGHWEWPHSTVAYVRADQPTGPYRVIREHAYAYANGYGHNPDVILLNDGSFLLYSLINWEATLFHADSMAGPWERLGTMMVDTTNSGEPEKRHYRFYRNLSGVQREDGRFLFVTKAGAVMLSEGTNPLGPYNIMSAPIQGNPIIPAPYRNSNYEDPVIWKDEVQYHMIINAFYDYRAIYLRSPDGINWTFNPGTAYTANSTVYEDGTPVRWYKLERPHVLTDEFGRATHLSLAVIDVPKRDDLARDNHSSKNMLIPLTVHRRLEIRNKKPLHAGTNKIKLLLRSEPGFDAQTDVDFETLRFGDPAQVDQGQGISLYKSKKSGDDIILLFKGTEHCINPETFACKLLGKTKKGKLLIAYVRR